MGKYDTSQERKDSSGRVWGFNSLTRRWRLIRTELPDVKYSTKGTQPNEFWNRKQGDLVKLINETGIELEGALVKASPTGTASFLKGGWSFKRATNRNPVGIIGQTQDYFLPVELGRKPGKGISPKGKESVALWAQRVLSMDNSEVGGEADQFANYLSVKYFREGRPAQGFAGLARVGTIPTNTDRDTFEPIEGGLIKEHLDRLRSRLRLV